MIYGNAQTKGNVRLRAVGVEKLGPNMPLSRHRRAAAQRTGTHPMGKITKSSNGNESRLFATKSPQIALTMESVAVPKCRAEEKRIAPYMMGGFMA